MHKFLVVFILLCNFLLSSAVYAATLEEVLQSSTSAGNLHPFAAVNRDHSLAEIAAAFDGNDQVFRAPKARELFKYAIVSQLGAMSDGQIAALLRSGQAQVVACQGSIRTTGYDNIGRVRWFDRPCEVGEQLLMVNGVVVASLRCLNPVSAPPVNTYVPGGGPCSQRHTLPEQTAGGDTWVFIAQSDADTLIRCNPDLTFCHDCQDFVDGRARYLPVGEFEAFIASTRSSGDRVVGYKVSGDPVVIWMEQGDTLFYCLSDWGRGSRVDVAPAQRH